MSSTSTTWTTDTNTKSGTVQVYSSDISVLRITAGEGADAILDLFADQGDDNADKWRMWVNSADDDLHFSNYTSGTAWTDILTLQDGGNIGIGTDAPSTLLDIRGTVNVGVDGTGHDVIFYSGTSGDNLTWDASEEVLQITGTNGATALDVLDGDVRVVDTLYFYDRGGESISSDGTDLTIAAGTALNITADVIDLSDATKDITLNAAVDALNFDSNTLSIDASNNRVGIGTTAPGKRLAVADSASESVSITRLATSGDIGSGGGVGQISFGTSDSSTYAERYGATIGAVADDNWTPDSKHDSALVFSTCDSGGSTTISERMRISTGGNVGIGWNSPSHKLVVRGDGEQIRLNSADYNIISLENVGSGGGLDEGMMRMYDSGSTKVQISTNGISYFSGGNVGIGTSTPDMIFEVVADSAVSDPADSNVAFTTYDSTQTDYSKLLLRTADGTEASPTAISANDRIGSIMFSGYDGDSFEEGAEIRGTADETFSGSARGTNLTFHTTDNTTTTLDERMRIDHNGKVGIGTAAPGRLLTLREQTGASAAINFADTNENVYGIVGLSRGADSLITGANDLSLVINNTLGNSDSNIIFGTKDNERMRIDDLGEVGIGATAPQALLHIRKAATTASTPLEVMRIDVYEASDITLAAGHGPSIDFYVPDAVTSAIGGRLAVVKSNTTDTDNSSAMTFYTTPSDGATPTEKMRIQSDGKVGIGTTVPADPLEVAASATINLTIGTYDSDSNTTGPRLKFQRSKNNTVGTLTSGDTVDNTQLGLIDFRGVTTGDTSSSACSISARQMEGAQSTYIGGEICFYTTEAGVGSAQRMCIQEDGDVGINTTTPGANLASGTANATYFDVSGGGDNMGIISIIRGTNSDNYAIGSLQWVNSNNNDAANNDTNGQIISEIMTRVETEDVNGGSDCGGHLCFNTKPDGGTLAERMRILDDGKVGIGTATPYSPLHIVSAAEGIIDEGSGNIPQVLIEGTGTAPTYAAPILCLHNSSTPVDGDTIGMLSFTGGDDAGSSNPNTGTEYANIYVKIIDQTDATTDGRMSFSTEVNDTITPTLHIVGGNVGIGTTDPGVDLTVSDATTSSSSTGGALRLQSNDSAAATGNGHRLGIIEFAGEEDANDNMVVGASISAYTEAAFTATDDYDHATALYFHVQNGTSDSNGLTQSTPAMCIDNEGKVGIGTNDPSTNCKLHIQGTGDPRLVAKLSASALTDTDLSCWEVRAIGNSVEAVAQLGVYYDDATANSKTDAPAAFLQLESSDGANNYFWTGNDDLLYTSTAITNVGQQTGTVVGAQSSDERLKNISSDAFPYGLNEVNKLTPIQFSYKGDDNSINRLGFGAQTAQKVIPESVFDTNTCIDGYDYSVDEDGKDIQTPKSEDTKLGMEYVQMIPVLVKAIQELTAKVEALENK